MIDRVGIMSNFSAVLINTDIRNDNECLAFRDMLTEKVGSNQITRHGYVGDGQSLGFFGMDSELMKPILEKILSLNDGTKNIWEIILQLEEKVDIKVLDENICVDFDDLVGQNGITGLLARFWKKKELLVEQISEFGINLSAYINKDYIYNKTVSAELDELILKKEGQKSVAMV